jgi:hypothetical protein
MEVGVQNFIEHKIRKLLGFLGKTYNIFQPPGVSYDY